MKQRSITSVFIVLAVALVVASKFLPYNIGTYIFDLFILCIVLISCFEINNIMEQANKHANKLMTVIFAIVNYAVLLVSLEYLAYYYIVLVQIAVLICYFLISMAVEAIKNKDLPFRDSIKISLNTIFTCVYPVFLFSLFVSINHIDIYTGVEKMSVVLILLVFAITMLTDSFAYLIGRAFKGPKLAPHISPNKTISGGIGGLLGGMAGSMLVYALVANVSMWADLLQTYNLAWWHFLILGLVASVFSQCGDLFESKLKRIANVKDSGAIFPGHGGMLDRIDAMTFCVVVIYITSIIIMIV